MCLMIVKPAGKDIADEHLQNGFENNPDGGGYCWHDGGRVFYRKGIFAFEEFLKSYRQDVGDKPAIVHFRMATHGGVNEENCHPFDVGNGAMMAHNGIIQVETERGESDTRAFIRKRIAPVLTSNPDAVRDPSWVESIDAAISGSKLGFLYPDGKHYIIGEKRGQWEDGVWFSNSGHKASCHWWSGRGAWDTEDEVSYWKEEGVTGAMTPAEAEMDNPEVMDVDNLFCDICGWKIRGRFTIDRRTSVMACNSCVTTTKTYKLV